jgi:formyltetrahydrofolate deformylase
MTRYIMTTRGADQSGIVAALTASLGQHNGFIHELAQFSAPGTNLFFSRICFAMKDSDKSAFMTDISKVAQTLGLSIDIIPEQQKMRTLIMLSKFDHCLNDLLYRYNIGSLNIEIPAIASNHETHRKQVEIAGIPFHHIPITKETKPQAEATLRELIDDTNTDLIVLARYMQILSEDVCRDFSGRIINIHHSFLPSFKGAKPYHRAYARGVKLIGATAHYVTSDLDEGPIIEQQVQRVDHSMTAKDLVALGRDVESQTLARAVKLHSERRSFINGEKTVILP